MDTVVCLAAHPDDVAACMGGTLLLLKDRCNLHVLCATKGERGLPGRPMDETAAIRQAEEQSACDLLGAKLTFLGRIDAEAYADRQICGRVAALLDEIGPSVLFTLWPIDQHPDHSAVSEVARKALGAGQAKCPVVYFEAALSCQTSQFVPDVYVDVTDVTDRKIELIRLHACQNRDDQLVDFSMKQSTFRGWECGCRYAEGFKLTRPLKVAPEFFLKWTGEKLSV